jgi:hypothetical protein
MDITLINLERPVYTTQANCKASIVDGTTLHKFGQVQISSSSEDSLNVETYTPILQKILAYTDIQKDPVGEEITENTEEITENTPEEDEADKNMSLLLPEKVYNINDFALVNKRNGYLASFDYVDDVTNGIFFGEDLYYYKINGLSDKVRNTEKYRLIFFQMTNNYMVPLILEKSSILSDNLVEITKLINNHGFEYQEDDIKDGCNFNTDAINWELTVEDYYTKVAEIQAKQRQTMDVQEITENREGESVFIERDENSRVAVMFNLSSLLSTGPSYEKKEVNQQVNLRINISDLVCNILNKHVEVLTQKQNAGEGEDGNSVDEEESENP